MRFLPVVFGLFLMRFPAGLFLYWITSNIITFIQNYLIYGRSPSNPQEGEDEVGTQDQQSPKKDAPAQKDAPERRRKRRKKAPNKK